ncbi:PAP2 family phosphoesterase [Bombiscardovia apis]|uniref:PAP2 family phosphoesterase n=1 Tax=Bombiscardovia apis TaxID=2932182 RepID=A0ABM8BEH2_9BIFI|nr:phosphatase PAP2 family protein [Bombiscardovia apis]BDR55331.1 PAP2 family phosphoesterase [Bombiscardovia apis]
MTNQNGEGLDEGQDAQQGATAPSGQASVSDVASLSGQQEALNGVSGLGGLNRVSSLSEPGGFTGQARAEGYNSRFAPLGSSDAAGLKEYATYAAQNGDFGTQAALKDLQELAKAGDTTAAEEAEELERMDPLTRKPRASSWISCLILGLLFLAAAAGVWWLGVYTLAGQQYEDEVYRNFAGYLQAVPLLKSILGVFTISKLTIGVSCAIGALGYAIAALRKRWWLLAQVVLYSIISYGAGRLLKAFLPRPYIINSESMHGNSAPSGHTIMAATVVIVLLCVVPRVWRAFCAVIGFLFTMAVGYSVIDGRWHRPTDVIMAILIAGGLALIMLAATRASGMDEPGTRYSSASVQIVSTIMITAGILGGLYGAFLVWQMVSGLEMGARWTFYGAHVSAVVFIASASAIVFGSLLALRQVTASPLSKIGLLGAPPTPPEDL